MSAYRDIFWGHVFGFGRLLIPILGYAFIYPLFIRQYDIRIFAIWSLIFSISFAISLSDLGLSDSFTRRIATHNSTSLRTVLKAELALIRRVTILAGSGIFLVLVFLQAVWRPFSSIGYDEAGVITCLLTVAAASLLSIQSRLSEAPFRAFYQNGFLQLLQTLKQIGSFASLGAGVLLGHPLEIFGLGYLVSEMVYLVMLVIGAPARVPQWHSLPSMQIRGSKRRVALAIVRRSASLFALNLALIFRDPLLRIVVAAKFGLAAAGAYELVYRVAISGFNACAAGVSTFLPNLSRVGKSDAGMRSLVKILSRLMAGLSAGCMGSAILMIAPLLKWWTGPASIGLTALSAWFLFWLWINLLFLPAWYLIIARHRERQLILLVLAHMLTTIPLLALPYEGFLTAWCLLGSAIYGGYFLQQLVALNPGRGLQALAGYGLGYSGCVMPVCLVLSLSGWLDSSLGLMIAAVAINSALALRMCLSALRDFAALDRAGAPS